MLGVVTYITPSTTIGFDVHVRALVGVAGVVFPGGPQSVHVRGVNLRQRSELCPGGIAAVNAPVEICAAVLGTLRRLHRDVQ